MTQSEIQQLKALISMTAEAMGREISDGAILLMAKDLEGYRFHDAAEAIQDCRRTLFRPPTIADIIQRIESRDGRPGPEEAWALIPRDEVGSVVWTSEMAEAYGVVHAMLHSDEVGARMAFREKYSALIRDARERKAPVQWSVSSGSDPSGREAAVRSAMRLGRISESVAAALSIGSDSKTALPSPEQSVPPEEACERIKALIAKIANPIEDEDENL